MKKVVVSLFIVAMAILSCKKDNTVAKSPAEYLLAHKWAMVSATINPAYDWYATGSKITDIFAPKGECIKDDLMVFNKDSSYFVLTGAVKCETYQKDTTDRGTYSISKDFKNLTRSEFDTPSLIKEISDTRVVFETSFIGKDKATYVLTETLQAK